MPPQSYKLPHLAISTFSLGVPLEEPTLSTALTNSWPSITSPKTVCLPLRWGVGTVVMKNCDPLLTNLATFQDKYVESGFGKAKGGEGLTYVLGPEFAIESR